MDVSVIIVNYNTKKLTNECISSIVQETSGIQYEIILVDNASTDGSIELFRADKRVKFIESCENLGFGKANNLGYLYTKGKYILLLNSDTLLLNNAIKYFFDYAEHSVDNIACLGGLLLNQQFDIIHSFGSFPSCGNLLLHALSTYLHLFGIKCEYNERKHIKSSFFVDYITGADLFIKREAIEKVGFFDPEFFLYYEETDLQRRFTSAGYKMMIIDTPKIIHLDGGSSHKKGKLTMKQMSYITDGRFKYAKKHFSSFSYLIFRVSIR